MRKLPPVQQRDLRARAHHLHPIVSIAENGLSDAVLAELERSLQAHELIKIRVFGYEHDARNQLMIDLCEKLDAAPVQHIGKLLIIWRERREVPADSTPTDAPRKNLGAKNKSAKAFAASARRAALAAQAPATQRPLRARKPAAASGRNRKP